ncbi:methylated-DNA--[protein]-cysteine S-methyltransferase [Luteimicrobium subarcticum]|uniref:Methylated-DNA--protein-cysteine methyltransferase n=1 Tax=Luteimicrobium subarcticum TaxID=620910 RepID=A0A2M8WV39_9MICO|nr:methylated-DNA--[protein]-cysteine S-methyltransferase [Luteimicrobium subarcticum]PJI94793.1 methylated-DNA-[protein]-cysteine S-methyltransferase [Luteimicrobium subarcticum]
MTDPKAIQRTAPQTRTVHAVVDSPVGPLTLVADDDALAGVFMTDQRHLPADDRFGERVAASDEPVLAAAASELAEYFAGEREEFDVPLAPRGTDFQQRVWARLREIPAGATTTYGTIAADLGLPPGASRAVGAAVGRNPIGIVVPCHRVVGASGALTGYAGGLERKVWLLEHEGVLASAP